MIWKIWRQTVSTKVYFCKTVWRVLFPEAEFETSQLITEGHCHHLGSFNANYIDDITWDTTQTKRQFSNVDLEAAQDPKALQQH